MAQIATTTVSGGKLAGTVDGELGIFKGIPFAAPPVGPLRWRAPQPAAAWSGTRPATAFGPGCMQDPAMARQMGDTGALSEDCLYLNVWTPAKAASEKRPVIVWIYGGGFNGGTTAVPLYDGANLAKRGIVFVSIAYRVGPFGFLASPELSRESKRGSGAYGLEDQIAGLKWVQANIARFGGDPARVTLLGHSAGGFAVSMLAASPRAKGLFHGVIAESGANFAPARGSGWGGSNFDTLKFAEANGQAFLAKLGAADLAQARALPAPQVEAAQRAPGAPRFWPPLDGFVLTEDPHAAWRAGRFNDTPVIVGSNSDEGAMSVKRDMTPAEFERQIRAGYGARADLILAAYPHATPADAVRAAKQVARDTSFGWPAYAWAGLQATHGKGRPYVYYFDRPTPQAPDGSSHGAEVGLVFGNLVREGRPAPTDEDRALSDRMQRYWINFARTGDPNGDGLPQWPAFAPAAPMVMRFGADPGAAPVPNLSKLKALDDYYAWRRSEAGQVR
jgi:para-nitrobenzyl esterase